MNKIVIVIRGGLVEQVFSENKDLDVEVIDLDVDILDRDYKLESVAEVSNNMHEVY